MSLGPNNEICTQDFIAAMRARLEEEEAGLGATVDKPGAQKNLRAYGEAIYRITRHATIQCNTESDAIFWAWLNDLHAFAVGAATWQQGVIAAFEAWQPTDRSGQQLRTALLNLRPLGAPPPPPAQLQGRIL